MVCPRCKSSLEDVHIDTDTITVCRHCGGMWLHKHQLNRLLKDVHGDVEMCSMDNNPHPDEYPVIKCRECKDSFMKKINFLGYSDIIIDYCSKCGSMWLDKNELYKAHKYMKRVEDGSHEVKYPIAYNWLVKLSQIAYSIFN